MGTVSINAARTKQRSLVGERVKLKRTQSSGAFCQISAHPPPPTRSFPTPPLSVDARNVSEKFQESVSPYLNYLTQLSTGITERNNTSHGITYIQVDIICMGVLGRPNVNISLV